MDELNLLSCVNHVKKIINRLEYYVTDECSKNIHTMTMEELEGLKEGYSQVAWMDTVFKSMTNKLQSIKEKYENAVDPIFNEIECIVDNGSKSDSLTDYSLKMPGFDIYYKLLNDDDSWGENQERIDTISDLISLRKNGYPYINNINPLKKILSNPFRYCVGTLDVNEIPADNREKVEVKTNYINPDNNIIGEYDYECGGASILLPVINSLNNIPLSLYYYYGDQNGNPRGVYIKLSNNVVIQVPMVNVISEDMENSRLMTVKCNNGDTCNYWHCTYTHHGVPYNIIGYKNRCPSNPGFSNKDTLKSDIEGVDYYSLRMCLLNSLSDLFSVAAWCQEKKKNRQKKIIISNLELCGSYPDPFVADDI